MEICKSSTTPIYRNPSKVVNKELDIFSDAKFGSKYVTRNGDIALFLCDCILIIQGTVTPLSYNPRGVAIEKDKGYDIIGKYSLWFKIKNYIKKKYCNYRSLYYLIQRRNRYE